MRAAIFAALGLLGAGCSCSSDPDLPDPPDPRCEGVDPATEIPVLSCPSAMVDLGCIDPAGAPLSDVDVSASGCTADPGVVCTPSLEGRVMPGDTTFRCTATLPGGSDECEFTVRGLARGSIGVECAPAVTASCTGATTPVMVPAPMTIETCGSAGTITDDSPGSFPVGDTVVTFTAAGGAGFSTSCTTTVTVTDDTPPSITCPPALTVVRATPEMAVAPPVVTATDACDSAVEVATSPETLTLHGPNTVMYTATDDAGLTARCTTTVTVLDAFPVEGVRIASARITPGGATSIALVWEPPYGRDATQVRIERATGPDGPWTALGTQPVADLTFTDPMLPGNVAYYRVVTLAGTVAGGTSAPVRAYAIRAANYDLRGQTVPTVPFATTIYGVVRHPTDLGAGPFPLVIFIHGNHGICRATPSSTTDECATSTNHECPTAGWLTTPNAEGMAFQAETLAAHGYIGVTISANALNCRDDYLRERGQLVIEHLRRWRGWNTAAGTPFGSTFVGTVDLARVGLVGHSRGGEAVAHVPSQIAATPVPGVSIGSVFAIAPTDYHNPNPGNVPYATLLPACDADVYTLDGMYTYDRAVPTMGSPRSQVFMAGANHNFYNTQWRNDDNGDGIVCRLSAEVGAVAQQAMVETTIAAWFEGTIGRRPGGLEPFLRADVETPQGIQAHAGRTIDLRWSHSAAARMLIDDFSGVGAPTTNRLGRTNTFTSWYVSRACRQNDCDRDFDADKWAAFLSWMGNASGTIGLGTLDMSTWDAFSFRIVSRRSTLNDGLTVQDFNLRLVDSDGTEAAIRLSELRRIPHLYDTSFPREMLQTVRIRRDWLQAAHPDLNVAALTSFELDVGPPDRLTGSFLLTDIELAR